MYLPINQGITTSDAVALIRRQSDFSLKQALTELTAFDLYSPVEWKLERIAVKNR